MYEREVKLSAPTGFRWPIFAPDSALVATALDRKSFQTVYFDTADLRLARWGCSLRHRSGEGWTLKLPTTGVDGGPLLVRGEFSFEGDALRPPDAAVGLVKAYLRGAETKPVARLRTIRHPVRLDSTDAAARPIAEMVLDEVSVLEGRRLVERFREVEVEIGPETSQETLAVILEALRGAGAVPTVPVPKYARALGTRAWAPPEVLVGELTPTAAAGQLVRHAIAVSVERYLRQEPGVRLAEDAEALHQARVAIRRLRSDLRTFGPLIEPAWAGELNDRLRWLAGLLGEARDADVMHERLHARIGLLADEDRPAAGKLVADLATQRQAAHAGLLGAMDSQQYLSVLQVLVDSARSPRLLPGSHQPAQDAATELLAVPWRRLRRHVQSLGVEPADADLHEVRIRAKRVRYAAEAVRAVLGRRAGTFARSAAGLQEVLGDHQDAVVAGNLLRQLAAGAPAEVAFAAGELSGLERAAAAEARARWPGAWKHLRRAARTVGL